MATLNEIKTALKAAGVKDYAFHDTDLDGRAAIHIRFDDLPSDTPSFRAVLAPFKAQMDATDKGILFLA